MKGASPVCIDVISVANTINDIVFMLEHLQRR